MTNSEADKAFFRGIEKFCSANGTPEFAVPLTKFASVAESYRLDPEAFAKGFDRFVKEAVDADEIKYHLRKLLPWVLVPAALYGVAKGSEMWGRHAYATGNGRGPITGPAMALFESLAGTPLTYVGRKNARAIASDWKSKPLTADQHEMLHRTGSLAGS